MKRINGYLNDCFEPYEMSEELANLKEEVIANATEHYQDLIAQGSSEQEAEDTVMASLGDIRGLLQEIGAQRKETIHYDDESLDKNVIRQFTESMTGIFTRALNGTGDRGVRSEVYANIDAVEIRGVSADTVMTPSGDELVHVRAEGNLDEISLEVKEGVLVIKEELAGNLIFRSGMDIALEVPVSTRSLDVQVVSGDLTIQNAGLDTLSFTSTSGDLTIRKGNLAELNVRSASGDVSVYGESLGRVDVKLVSGDIDLSCRQAGELSAECQSGDIDVFVRDRFASIWFKTVSGDVSMKLPSHEGISPELRSLSGSIDAEAMGTAGGAGVTVKTVSGDIRLRTTQPAQ